MKIVTKEYSVMNSMMDPEFQLTPEAISYISQDVFATYMSGHWCSAFDLRARGLMWIISDFTFRITGCLPFWTEKFQVEIWISEEPGVKLRQDFRFLSDGQEFCRGDYTWAMLDIESRKPINSATQFTYLEVNPDITLGTHRHKYPAPLQVHLVDRHLADNSDKDFNYHVTNITYVRQCMNALPTEYLSTHAMTEFSIKFEHETFVGQELICTVSQTDTQDTWYFDISTAQQPCVCKAYAKYTDQKDSTTVYDRELEVRKVHGLENKKLFN